MTEPSTRPSRRVVAAGRICRRVVLWTAVSGEYAAAQLTNHRKIGAPAERTVPLEALLPREPA